MTSYTAIANGDIDQDSPVTQPLVTALRDNPIAIGEADSSVPAGLLPTVLLGTLTTTSGTTQTLTSLNLTPYKYLYIVFDGVSTINSISATRTLTLAGCTVWIDTATDIGAVRGTAIIDLATSAGCSSAANIIAAAPTSATAQVRVLRTSVTTATTSISVTADIAFDDGRVLVYGAK